MKRITRKGSIIRKNSLEQRLVLKTALKRSFL